MFFVIVYIVIGFFLLFLEFTQKFPFHPVGLRSTRQLETKGGTGVRSQLLFFKNKLAKEIRKLLKTSGENIVSFEGCRGSEMQI